MRVRFPPSAPKVHLSFLQFVDAEKQDRSRLVVGGHYSAEVFHLGKIQFLPTLVPLLERLDVNVSSGSNALIGSLENLQWNRVADRCVLQDAHEQSEGNFFDDPSPELILIADMLRRREVSE